MHPLTELRRLLAPRPRRRTGTVISISRGQAEVSTGAGIQTASLGETAVAAGDRVAIEDGRVIGRLSAAAPAVYEV